MSQLSRQSIKIIQHLYYLSALLLLQGVLPLGTHHGYDISVSKSLHGFHTRAKSSETSETSDNWSGYVAHGPSGTFNKAQFTFTIPSLDPSMPGITSSWVGLSGWDQGQGTLPALVQAGVDSSMNTSSGRQMNEAWIEINPLYGPKYIQFPGGLQKGDSIYVYVSSGLNNSDANTFYFYNARTRQHYSFSKNGQRFLSDGTTSECILELLDNETLADFGTERFTNCSASGKEPVLHPIKSYRTTKIDLATKGRKLTSTGSLDSKGLDFNITWLHG